MKIPLARKVLGTNLPKPLPPTEGNNDDKLQNNRANSLAYGRAEQLMNVHVIPWGRYKGTEIRALPTDYLDWFLKTIEEKTSPLYQAVERERAERGAISNDPGEFMWPFGKYKTWKAKDIPTEYLEWWVSACEDTGRDTYCVAELLLEKRYKDGEQRG